MRDTGSAVTTLAREQMKKLAEAASAAYKDARHIQAAELFKQALAIAEDLNDGQLIIQYRFWASASLAQIGKYNAALQEILPTLQQDNRDGDPADIYNTYTKYLNIALDLPVSLAALEKVLQKCEDFLIQTGHSHWRHMILHLESRLLSLRAQFPGALKKARESWGCYSSQYPRYILDGHLNQLTTTCLDLEDVPAARQYLAEWERQKENEIPKNREIRLGKCQSGLARLEKRKGEAVEWARRADFTAQQTDEPLWAVGTMLEAFLAAGDVEHTTPLLVRLRETRFNESMHDQYDFYLLLGDNYLARARKAAGMEPRDETFDHEFPAPRYIKDLNKTRRETRRARRAYGKALDIGSRIDTLLVCSLRQEQIAGRMKRLQAIENRCNNQDQDAGMRSF
ncbi:MAG: hypothetical protein MUF15_05415 [Acidobacteria bacterium]|nr:hypothetical protein [Acidobacteriota bacterium]